jgi:hypothetical protein
MNTLASLFMLTPSTSAPTLSALAARGRYRKAPALMFAPGSGT